MMQRVLVGAVALSVAAMATIAKAEPRIYRAKLTPEASVARNSTPLETRKDGVGEGLIIYDQATGEFKFMLSFSKLVATDITTGTPSTDPAMRDGRNFNGAGVLVEHIHVGALGFNGNIPQNFIAADMMDGKFGKPDGVIAMPDPIQMATNGMVMGTFNLKQIAGLKMGMLDAGIPLDGPGPSKADPGCIMCGFNQAIMTNNTYLNIHPLNNPFGEIRGQVIAEVCTPRPAGTTVDALLNDLDARVKAVEAKGSNVDTLKAAAAAIRQGVTAKDNPTARAQVSEFLGQVIAKPTNASARPFAASDVDALICGASDLAAAIPLPLP